LGSGLFSHSRNNALAETVGAEGDPSTAVGMTVWAVGMTVWVVGMTVWAVGMTVWVVGLTNNPVILRERSEPKELLAAHCVNRQTSKPIQTQSP